MNWFSITDGKLAVTGFEAASPDLCTRDSHPRLGRFAEGSGIYCATGFSGAGFKNATGYGETAAHEALDKQTI